MWNDRTDEYGGTLENRMRFTCECIADIKAHVPKGFPVLVKFTPYHGVEGGRTLDEVVLAHQMLANPFWSKKVEAEHLDDIRPCIGCNGCLLSGCSGKHYYCAVNPECYAERDYRLPAPTGEKRSVLVIGGGPGGLEAAIAAADRGYKVTLWEKSSRLGGNLWAAGGPSFKHDVLRLIGYMHTQVLEKGVEVVLCKDATADEIVAFGADKVILAAGAHSIVPAIEGVEGAELSDAILLGKTTAQGHVVVIGGGLVGCETACMAAETAQDATIVEVLDEVLKTAGHCLNNDQALKAMMEERQVRTICSAKDTKIEDGSLSYEKDGSTETAPCDMAVLACGYRPNDGLAAELEGRVKELSVIGDAEAPRKILTAVHEGYHAIRVMG